MLVRMTIEAPTSSTAWYRLGLSHVKAQRFSESLEALTSLFVLEPEHALGHYSAACALTLRDADNVRHRPSPPTAASPKPSLPTTTSPR